MSYVANELPLWPWPPCHWWQVATIPRRYGHYSHQYTTLEGNKPTKERQSQIAPAASAPAPLPGPYTLNIYAVAASAELATKRKSVCRCAAIGTGRLEVVVVMAVLQVIRPTNERAVTSISIIARRGNLLL